MLRNRLLAALALASLALSFLGLDLAGAGTPQSRGIALLANGTGQIEVATNSAAYGYVVLKASQYDRIPALKAANPNVKVLAYKDMASTRSYAVTGGVDQPNLPAGVGYAYASGVHPEWFLTSTAGSRIEWAGFPGHWWMDPADPGYQDAWAANVAGELLQHSWDGVMIDNANAHRGTYLPSGTNIVEYPDDASYAVATESFLAKVGPQLQAKGLQVVANISFKYSSTWKAQYSRWVSYLSGAMREYWMKPGRSTGYLRFADGDWRYMMEQMAVVEGQGKVYLPVTYSDMADVETMRYGRASFLLEWRGGASSYAWAPAETPQDPWSTEWTVDVGTPLAPRYAVGAAWRRDFTGGTVVVNPSSSTPVTIPLGASFTSPTGAEVTSVTLQPRTALVLKSAVATTTTLAAPTTTTTVSASTSPTTGTLATTTTTTTTVKTTTTKVSLKPRSR